MLDAKAGAPVGEAEVFVSGGRKPTGRRVLEWVREAEERGAGEILLTSMDWDGTRGGFDCELTRGASGRADPGDCDGRCGQCTTLFAEVFKAGKADAALAASLFFTSASPTLERSRPRLRRAGVSCAASLLGVLPDGPPARRAATSWRVYLVSVKEELSVLPLVGFK